jgi:hypothetical protein
MRRLRRLPLSAVVQGDFSRSNFGYNPTPRAIRQVETAAFPDRTGAGDSRKALPTCLLRDVSDKEALASSQLSTFSNDGRLGGLIDFHRLLDQKERWAVVLSRSANYVSELSAGADWDSIRSRTRLAAPSVHANDHVPRRSARILSTTSPPAWL